MMIGSQAAPRTSERVSILIAALGGQGGGVLTGWIVAAARAQGLVAQATSTPGVSQRTGATTYYIELVDARAGEAPPVLGLAPVPGRVDVLVCAELLEAARMLERGMSAPLRTTVVASTHRVYTTREKMSGGDARFESARIVDAVRALSRRNALFDMEAIRRRHDTAISAVLFGALAGSGALPVARAHCSAAICAANKDVTRSVAAFDEAFARASGADANVDIDAGIDVDTGTDTDAGSEAHYARTPVAVTPGALPAHVAARVMALPPAVAQFAAVGVRELLDYQGVRYAAQYLDRVERVVAADARADTDAMYEVSREAARFLALWMAYDDVIRVASRKARASRLARIRDEAGADARAVVRVHDFFRPGALEFAAILPRRLGAWLERRARSVPEAQLAGSAGSRAASARRAARRDRGVTLHTSSFTGALALRLVAALRPLRPHSLRYACEQRAIGGWLDALEQALLDGHGAALDVARLPRLIRGYGDTHAAGRGNFERILAAYRNQCVADASAAAAALRASARDALNDSGCGPHPPAAAARSAAASSRA